MTLLAVLALMVPAQPQQRADTVTDKDSAAIRAAAIAFVKEKNADTGPVLISADSARTLVFARGGVVGESVRVERRAGKWVAVRVEGTVIH